MSDLERLEAAFARGSLLRPTSEFPTIVDLARAIAQLTGVQRLTASAATAALQAQIGQHDHLIFILADGVGLRLLQELPRKSFLRAHLAGELRTVFPSSTAPALTSLATGAWPAQHGVTGWWTHLPQLQDAATILPFVDRLEGRSLTGRVLPEEAFPTASLQARVRRDFLSFFPDTIANSTYSNYSSGGKPRRGYRGLRDGIERLIGRLTAATGPTYSYLYIPDVDENAHRHGIAESAGVLRQVNAELERLARAVAGQARIVMTADHGFLDATPAAKFRIKPSDGLAPLLRYPPSGDARVLYLAVRGGAEQRVRAFFRELAGERFALLTVVQAEALRLFGPAQLSAETRLRVGDLIAISLGADIIEYQSGPAAGRLLGMASHHSGLSPDEMRVPLILA